MKYLAQAERIFILWKSFLILFFLLLSPKLLIGQDIQPSEKVEIEYIHFDHESQSFNEDALSIRKDINNPIRTQNENTDYEWIPGDSQPAAYVKEVRPSIKIKFKEPENLRDGKFKITLENTSTSILRKEKEEKVISINGSGNWSPNPIKFDMDGDSGDVINRIKMNLKWEGNGTAKDEDGNPVKLKLKKEHQRTRHDIYVILDKPFLPWFESGKKETQPWVKGLKWIIEESGALGEDKKSSAINKIQKSLFDDEGGKYDTDGGRPFYSGTDIIQLNKVESVQRSVATIKADSFISTLKNSNNLGPVNCYDMSNGLSIMANLIGADMKAQFINQFGFLNISKPIGREMNNNPFFTVDNIVSDKIVPGNWNLSTNKRSPFGNHQVSRFNKRIWDTTMEINKLGENDFDGKEDLKLFEKLKNASEKARNKIKKKASNKSKAKRIANNINNMFFLTKDMVFDDYYDLAADQTFTGAGSGFIIKLRVFNVKMD